MAVPTFVKAYGAAGASISNNGNFPTTLENDIAVQSLSITGTTGATATVPDGWTRISDISINTGSAANIVRMITCWKRCAASESAGTWTSMTGYRFFLATIIRGCVETGTPFVSLGETTQATGSTSFSESLKDCNYTDVLWHNHCGYNQNAAGSMFGNPANAGLSSMSEKYDTSVTGGSGTGRWCWSGTSAAAGSGGTTTANISASIGYVSVALAMLSTTSTTGSSANSGFFNFMK